MVASRTSSSGSPIVTSSRQRNGLDLISRTTLSNSQFGPAGDVGGGFTSRIGLSDHRTGVRSPAALTK